MENYPILGMSCAACAGKVERALASVPGVAQAAVNPAAQTAAVRWHGRPDAAALASAVRGAGYDVPTETVQLAIEGMTCASCVGRVERALAAVPGVVSASVNLAAERASLSVMPGTDVDSLMAAAGSAGYAARRAGAEPQAGAAAAARAREAGILRRDVIVAALLTLPLFLLEMGTHAIPAFGHWLHQSVDRQLLHAVYLVLATAVQFGPGLRFYRAGVPALLRLAPDMNALVVLGSTAAWGYSAAVTLMPAVFPEGAANVYFEASAVIVTLILLGRHLEAKARGRTGAAIARLVGLRPQSAHVLRGGAVVEVPLAAVARGDIVEMRPGGRLPVDGTVIEGSSFVDQSMLTGEPMPVVKSVGAEVIGGTINKTGSFRYRATKVGADTLLAQIIRMVESAQGAKLPVQAAVDRVTRWFVPAVMAAAVLTFAAWFAFGPEPALTFALVNAVAVLIIACPCAMGLATPTSIMVATGRAAELGILIRNGEALQALRDTTVVAFDKTGTLTAGRPVVTDLVTAPGFGRTDVLALVAAVERRSEHPVAAAIVAAAEADGIAIPEAAGFAALPGHGARAGVAGRDVAVGTARYMETLGIDAGALADAARRLGAEARTPIFAAIDGRLAALIGVADPIRPTTPAAVAALKVMGLRLAMITGDNHATASAIAARLGIADVTAEVLPGAKAEALRRLRGEGRRIAFVGDGINDAPALAEADVGIAIGTGTDIAIESADVVLMSGDLGGVAAAIGLSRAAMRNIHQNLFWAFAYNVLLIPVAAGALYPMTGVLLQPMIAAGAMALSSVFVLSNALRLRRYSPATPTPRRDRRLPGPVDDAATEARR